MIKNIIFDIGNVLTTFAWQDFFLTKGFDQETFEKISKATVGSKQWVEYDRGLLTDEEIVDSFVANAPELEQELRSALSNVQGMVTRRDYAIPWIQELKSKGFGVYYLSNFSHKCETECSEALDFLPYTDGGILSYKDHVVKPDREIYELLLSRYGLQAEECVFLDDTATNFPMAEEVGMKTILFTTREEAVTKLKELGVE